MESDLIRFIVVEGLWLVLLISFPPILVATLASLIIAILQALTQIQEQTLAMSVKIITISIVLMASLGWSSTYITNYTDQIFEIIKNQ
ncbi:type III secretion system export apparatus subunit SctS [Spartinivicinus poritis]|uniref:Type III secretion system export apparatus subunit SctS n=1 Tax=Spartinivicinus poritis TaxID=2994640 RepID=A0ABT5U3K3_9GAMM|nr:type III secretion system export apparatus subunit SctS [Spartinivicinus sp. A2-2]MDE1460941.1 type III secretion system export apparatus subunit SctS [Spartinivicinus sp. A2-2]